MDRNIVSTVARSDFHIAGGVTASRKWHFELGIKNRPRLSPLLFAIEGDKRRLPTLSEFREQLWRGAQVLKSAFPDARVTSYDALRSVRKAYQLVQGIEQQQVAQAEFLKKTAPMIANRCKPAQRNAVEARILSEARSNRQGFRSLPVMAVLRCLYDVHEDPNQQSPTPARRVINPSLQYSDEDAYNALADIRCLELFIAALASMPEEAPVFCTSDNNLALLWKAFGIHRVRRDGGVKFELALGAEAFPALSAPQVQDLVDRLQ